MGRPKKNPDFVEKQCELCHKLYNVKYTKRNIQRFCSKLCSTSSPITKEKNIIGVKKTFDEKYGCHPMQTSTGVLNYKKAIVNKYGVDSYSKLPEFHEKVKKTLIKKYNDSAYNNKEKTKLTCLLKYNKENFTQTDEYTEKIKHTSLEKYGVEHPSMSNEFKKKHYENMFEKFKTSAEFKNFTPMFDIKEYFGVTGNITKYKFKCNRCSVIALYKISNGLFPRYITCDRELIFKKQREVYDFIREILGKNEIILTNDRTILYPQEIDIYIPSKKLAIEFNGLYWHSEISGNKNKLYHLNKTKMCLSKEIECIHIFENDWNNKTEIIKSILRNKLNGTIKKIGSRSCNIKEISATDSNKFLLENHIQGSDKSPIRIGLYHKDNIISVMTFCSSRFDTTSEYEMSRYCNKLNTSVMGSASKLFSYFLKIYKPKNVVSYSDRRLFSGNIYFKLGFNFVNNTSPNYFYIIDNYLNLFNRMNFQKHKLKDILTTFNPRLSEWENMKLNGYDRIWDCGNSKWIFTNRI